MRGLGQAGAVANKGTARIDDERAHGEPLPAPPAAPPSMSSFYVKKSDVEPV